MAAYKSRPCQYCGTPFKPHRIDQLNCGPACRKAWTNLEMRRGRLIYAYAYNWRKGRNTKAQREKARMDFAAMCREIDLWAEEDRKLGRPVPEGYTVWRGE